jgi:hypothetical protein
MQETLSMSNFLFIVKDLMGQIVGVVHVTKDEDINNIKCFIQFIWELCARCVRSKDASKLWSIDVQIVIIGYVWLDQDQRITIELKNYFENKKDW